MKLTLLGIMLLFIFGCAAPAKKEVSRAAMLGEDANLKTSSQIQKAVSRGSNQYGYYSVEVFPFTKQLVEVGAAELSKSKLENATEAKVRLNSDLEALFNKGTCFMFTVGSHSLESSKFVNWTAKVDDGSGSGPATLKISNVSGRDSVPSPNGFQGYTWANYSTACGKKIDLSKPFKVIVSPSLIPNAPITTLEWVVK